MGSKTKSLNFAFVGCGKIAHLHADVVRYLGHRIYVVVTKNNSTNIDSFAKKYAVRERIYGIGPFLDYCRKFKDMIDCILVCTPWDVTENILNQVLSLGLPVMAEKPAVLSMTKLNELKQNKNIKNLFVGYNRRFYDFIPFLEDLLRNEQPVCVDILSADPYEMIIKTHGKKIGKYILHYYTSHIIDLMFYLFGEVTIRNIANIVKNAKTSWVCDLYANNYKCPIQMKILMDCPQNSAFKVFFEKKVIEAEPLEKMVLYDRIERKASKGNAVYLPSARIEIQTDTAFKPGFLNQMKYFIEKFVYKRNSQSMHIKQLKRVVSFCDELIKSKNI